MREILYHGAAYYPELWPDTIEQDIAFMKAASINVVRMGEFAWAAMEPEQDKIDLSFFVTISNRLHESGIATIMCTPTETPPIWLTHDHPERLFVDANGVVMGHGARQHICTNNPVFRQRSHIITEAMARACGRLPGVIAWQLDNEFKCHVAECMCGECKIQWHDWLAQRYGTIDRLNDAWCSNVWSEHYQRFDQVPQPLPTPLSYTPHNASLATAYRLFSHDKITELANEQAGIIRAHSSAPITHNSNTGFKVNNETLFEHLDFVSLDDYRNYDLWHDTLMHYDLRKNWKRGQFFWVMETAPLYDGSLSSHRIPHPDGYMTAEAVAAYALGARGFCYWQWRQTRTGTEQNGGAIVSAWGTPTIAYARVQAVNLMRQELELLLTATIPCQPELAITYSDRARAYFFTEPLESLDYVSLMKGWHRHILDLGIDRDFIPEGADLAGYKILMSPFLPYLSPDYLHRAAEFVRNGGVWIAGPMTGWRTEEHAIQTDAALGRLEALAGVETEFVYPICDTGATGTAFGMTAPLQWWSTVFRPVTATSLGTIAGGLTPGLSFLTEQQLGGGKLVLLGSMPKADSGTALLQAIFEHYAVETGITMRSDVTPGTIVVRRAGNGINAWIVVNLDGKGGSVTLPSAATDAISGASVPVGRLDIGRYGYRAIRFD